MCSANLPFGDRRVVGSHQLDPVVPGAAVELIAAWTHHPQPAYQPCSLGDMFDEIQFVRDAYDEGFASVVSTSGPAAGNDNDAAFRIFPNPAAGRVRLEYGDHAAHRLRLFGPDGRLALEHTGLPPHRFEIAVDALPAGVYIAVLDGSHGSRRQKLVVLH